LTSALASRLLPTGVVPHASTRGIATSQANRNSRIFVRGFSLFGVIANLEPAEGHTFTLHDIRCPGQLMMQRGQG
jgi:hypothetical protein